MRLFIGVELSDRLRHAAARASERLRDRVHQVAPESRVRWIPGENLHVTVWFLGEVTDATAETVRRAMSAPLAVPAFTLRLEGAGAFPPSGEPRALWLGLTSGENGLLAIHDRLESRLGTLGFEPEKRAFSPHLTIGRVKEARRSTASAIRRVLRENTEIVGDCEIGTVTLFRSRTMPTGSQYEVVLRTPLTTD